MLGLNPAGKETDETARPRRLGLRNLCRYGTNQPLECRFTFNLSIVPPSIPSSFTIRLNFHSPALGQLSLRSTPLSASSTPDSRSLRPFAASVVCIREIVRRASCPLPFLSPSSSTSTLSTMQRFQPQSRRPLSFITSLPSLPEHHSINSFISSPLISTRPELRLLRSTALSAQEFVTSDLLSGEKRRVALSKRFERILEEVWGNGEKVDRVLLGWEKGWLEVWESSTGTQRAHERIVSELEKAERAVEKGGKLMQRSRRFGLRRIVKREFRVRELYADIYQWQVAEIYSVINGIRSRFYQIQVERNRNRELSIRERDDGFRALLGWERDLATSILRFLKQSRDRKQDWIRVKFELKRLELVAKDQAIGIMVPSMSALFAVANVLERIKEWKVPSSLTAPQINISPWH